MYKFQRHADDLMGFYQKRYKVKQVPQVIFKDDKKNSQNVLGRTGQYDPHNKVVTIFVTGRHGKDVLRSLAHELIHHLQNERGDLANIGSLGPGYAQKDDHMRNMEREAYEQGNLCLRDWEDQIKTNNIQLYETIYKADRTKGDSVMSLKEQRNVNFHNKLMESWGFSKKDEESVLLKEEKAPAGEPTSENIEEGAGVGLTMDFIDGWKGGQRTNDGDEGDDEENTQVLKTNHPNDPGNRTKYNKKVEETIRKAIRNILNEIM